MYVIRRNDGAYVAPSGGRSSYTRLLQHAQLTRTFHPAYSPTLHQYVVVRGAVQIVPTPTLGKDEDAKQRAPLLAAALNRVYAI